jgi:adenine-specific DNA-methyltransferase
LIQYLISILDDDSATVLDFFAGSVTTAQAVAKLNAEDGGSRRFILVSSTEATADEPDKNLCRDVCAMRVRRVLGGYTNTRGERVEGLGGGFAYLRTRRIAPYRLSTRIAHAEVWRALQLIHDRALTRWQGSGFQHDGALGYLADFREASLAALRAWLGDSRGAGRTLYAWTPHRIGELAPEADIAPIPDFLRARFGR